MFMKALAIAIGAFIAAPMFIVIPMSLSDSPSFAFPPTGYWLGVLPGLFHQRAVDHSDHQQRHHRHRHHVVTMALVVPASFALVRFRFLGRGLVNFLLIMPLMVPHIVLALGYYAIFSPVGLTNSHIGVIIAHTCVSVPVAFLIVSATLKGFDRNLERAAMSSGAGPLRTFFHVTLPVLRPGFLVAALFAFIHSFDETGHRHFHRRTRRLHPAPQDVRERAAGGRPGAGGGLDAAVHPGADGHRDRRGNAQEACSCHLSGSSSRASIAVYGASENRGPGRRILEMLERMGYGGAVYPVNPRYEDGPGEALLPGPRGNPRGHRRHRLLRQPQARDRALPTRRGPGLRRRGGAGQRIRRVGRGQL